MKAIVRKKKFKRYLCTDCGTVDILLKLELRGEKIGGSERLCICGGLRFREVYVSECVYCDDMFISYSEGEVECPSCRDSIPF